MLRIMELLMYISLLEFALLNHLIFIKLFIAVADQEHLTPKTDKKWRH